MLPSISVIVPAKNEEEFIGNCLESIVSSNYPEENFEVIVSIDGSTDRTLEICKKFEPRVKVIESKPKKCKAEALNEVLHKTKGEIIAVFDADCVVDKNCLKEAAKNFSKNEIAGVSGAIKTYNKDHLLARVISLETSFTSFMECILNKFGANSHFLGKNMFIRKSILEEIGGFDEFSFLEDIELSLRMKRLGYKIISEPKAITWQNEPHDFKSYLSQRRRWARGAFRIKNLKMQNSVKSWLSDLMHAVPYYVSPFGLIVLTILLIAFYLNLPIIFILPLLLFFFFNLGLIVYSRIFYKENFKDLVLFPLWFLLTNFYTFFIVPKAYIDEKRNKEMKW